MEQFDLKDLKKWREERGLTIPYISKQIGMRTVTIKALEEGKQKPQKRSLDKLLKFIREYQGPIVSQTVKKEKIPALKTEVELEKLSRKEVAETAPSGKKTLKPVSATQPAPEMKRKRGRPKLQKPTSAIGEMKMAEMGAFPAPTKRERKSKAESILPLRQQEERFPKISKPEFAPPIQLTNLDLELINRVLSLDIREKLDLIAKLSQER